MGNSPSDIGDQHYERHYPPRRPRLRTADDVRRYLANLIHETREGKVGLVMSGKLGFLLNILACVLRDADFEDRLAALEQRAVKESSNLVGRLAAAAERASDDPE